MNVYYKISVLISLNKLLNFYILIFLYDYFIFEMNINNL